MRKYVQVLGTRLITLDCIFIRLLNVGYVPRKTVTRNSNYDSNHEQLINRNVDVVVATVWVGYNILIERWTIKAV